MQFRRIPNTASTALAIDRPLVLPVLLSQVLPYKACAHERAHRRASLTVCSLSQPPAFPENVSSEATSFLSKCLIINPESRLKASELLQHPVRDSDGPKDPLVAAETLVLSSVSPTFF